MKISIGQRAARAAFGALVALSMTGAFAQTSTPVGMWQSVDDVSGEPKAIIQIADDGDGRLSGKIVRGIGRLDDPERRCTACTGERKGQLLKGMTIMTGMHQDGDEWNGGEILDPSNGKSYKCKMKLADGGQKLVVRGFIGISLLGRSQTWLRQP